MLVSLGFVLKQNGLIRNFLRHLSNSRLPLFEFVVWSKLGPVPEEYVRPRYLLQSKWSTDFRLRQLHRPDSNVQLTGMGGVGGTVGGTAAAGRVRQPVFRIVMSSMAMSPWKLAPQTPSKTTCSKKMLPSIQFAEFWQFFAAFPRKTSVPPNFTKRNTQINNTLTIKFSHNQIFEFLRKN